MKNKLFTEVYTKYHRLVIKSVIDQTGNHDLAQEICQLVFLRFYDKMDTVDMTFVKTWLMLLTKHLVIDNQRLARVRKEVSMPVTNMNAVIDFSLENVVDRNTYAHLVFEIMEDLKTVNERWYQVITLTEVEGLSQEETAAKLNISITVLRARVYRAKQYIRNKYQDEYDRQKE